jgi:hypothetical protein
VTALETGLEFIRIQALRRNRTGQAKMLWMTDIPKKRGPRVGQPHRGQNPEYLGEYLKPLPEGHITKQMRISGPPEAVEWFASLDPRARGEIAAEALEKFRAG